MNPPLVEPTPKRRLAPLALMLALAASLATSLAACTRCAGTPPSDLRLTEKDTTIPAERLVHGRDGGSWTLTMPNRDWRLVNDSARARLRPEVEVWLVNPVRDAYLTVQCVGDRTAAQLEPALRVAAERAGRTFTPQGREPLEGPWVRGVALSYATATAQNAWVHVDGLFDLLGTTCDVQASATNPTHLPELQSVVRSFTPSLSPAARALLAPSRALAAPAMQTVFAELLDAGVPEALIPVALVERGMRRLPDVALEERFDLRRRMLDAVPPEVCGAIVAQSDDGALLVATLDRLEPAQAERWGQLSVEAITAEAERLPPVPLDRTEVAEAQRAWLALDGVREADLLLSRGDTVPLPAVCQAERTRLKAAFSLDPAVRVRLFRSWLADRR